MTSRITCVSENDACLSLNEVIATYNCNIERINTRAVDTTTHYEPK